MRRPGVLPRDPLDDATPAAVAPVPPGAGPRGIQRLRGGFSRIDRRAVPGTDAPTIRAPSTLPSDSPTVARRGVVNVAFAVAVAHGVNDAYAAFLHPLLPRIMDKLGLSIALAATLAIALSLAASLLQPVMGYFADRFGRRWFVALGPLVSGLFLSMIGLAPSFWMLILLLALGGLGSAAFHPPAASLAARVSEGKGSGLRLSIFSFGGTMGYAVGPLVAVAIVSGTSLEGLWVAMFPGLLLGLALLWILPPPATDRHPDPPPSIGAVGRALRGPLGLVFGISALGAFIQRVFLTMYPIIVDQSGGSEAVGAVSLSVYLAAQGGGTLTGGVLTDRVNRARLLAVLTGLALPAHVLAVWLPPASPGSYVAVAAAGFLNMAILPPVVVIGQEILPAGAAVSSGIVMGLAWATGTLGVAVTGVLGDAMGARAAAAVSMPVILAATLLALHPSLRRHSAPSPARTFVDGHTLGG